MTDAELALAALKENGFAMGPGYEQAHTIAQRHEGEALFDWIHALCHRIEGDTANAGYWYRKSGKAPFEGSFAEEHDAIAAEIGGQ